MDKKTALNILNLDAAVSVADAKKAYRNLAKKYHPDVVENNPLQKRNAETKMKEINLAFRYLAPLLGSDETIKKTKGKNHGKGAVKDNSIKYEKNVIFSYFSKTLGILFTAFQKNKDSRPFENKSEKEKPVKKTRGKKVRFDDILKSAYTVSSDGERKAKRRKRENNYKKRKPYNGYQKYMALKRKMKSGQSNPNQDMGIGKADKIDPVKPVNPIGRI